MAPAVYTRLYTLTETAKYMIFADAESLIYNHLYDKDDKLSSATAVIFGQQESAGRKSRLGDVTVGLSADWLRY